MMALMAQRSASWIGSRAAMPAILLHGATVRTMDPRRPMAGAVLVVDGSIAGLDVAPQDAPSAAGVIDLRGRAVVPGFTDAHVHFPSWALARSELRLEDTRSAAEVAQRVADAARTAPPSGWLRGRGWRETDWAPGEAPSLELLDRAGGDRRVALIARDGHSVWLSSAALAVADLSAPVVERDAHGRPTGVLREAAAFALRDTALRPTTDELVAATRAALPAAHARGVTAIHDKDGGSGAPAVFARLRQEEALTLRVWQSVPASLLDELGGAVDYVKAFMDGTLSSGTALMLDGSGVALTGRQALEDIVRRAAQRDLAVAVHAIGDAANRSALDAFEATRRSWAPRGLRPRIEHAQFIAPEDLPRFARLGVAASVQFTHATSDRDAADARGLGGRPGDYAYRALADAGAILAGGSDAPVEELDPLMGLQAAVARTTDSRPPWHPEQALSAEQALAAFTTAPAWLAHGEDRYGRIAAGLEADLVVLERDPLTTPPEQLGAIGVTATMRAGRWVHGPPPLL